MAGDDDILNSPDGLTDSERAEFAQMQEATSGDAPPIDPAAGAADAAAKGGADAGAADAGAAARADAGKESAAKDGVKEGAAADAGAEDDDDDGEADTPVLDAAGKPVLAADGKPARRKARVSANKYNAEKTRADKLTADLADRDQKLARFDERMRLLSEALTTPKAEAKKEEPEQDIDLEADVFGGINQIRVQTRKEIADLKKAISDMQQGKQTEDGQKIVADAYTSDAMQFAGREPNFAPAYKHLMASRAQELALFHFGIDLTAAPVIGPDGNPISPLTQQQSQRIMADITAEERGIAENAIAQGRSPAQAVYQMARYRGYTPQKPPTAEEKAAAAAAANGKGTNGAAKPGANGKANGAADNGGKGGNVSEEIERIKAGSEAALSLSDGGASPANPMTPQKLADMPQDQFNAIMDRADPEEIRALFEGRA